jgi:hypothetical protein
VAAQALVDAVLTCQVEIDGALIPNAWRPRQAAARPRPGPGPCDGTPADICVFPCCAPVTGAACGIQQRNSTELGEDQQPPVNPGRLTGTDGRWLPLRSPPREETRDRAAAQDGQASPGDPVPCRGADRQRRPNLPLLRISRQAFYTWYRRYDEHGLDGLRDRSMRPQVSPNATRTEVVGKILCLRQHYHFGPAKMVASQVRWKRRGAGVGS